MDMKKIEDSEGNSLLVENQKDNLIDKSAIDAVSKIDMSGYNQQ
ncbi:hypothetical protein P4T34_23390 [Bacillus mobilis]|nr:hypothetical protein [Bacillus mobilis]